MQEALTIANTVTEAEKQERDNEIFFTGTEGSSGSPTPAPGRKSRKYENARQGSNTRSGNQENNRSIAEKGADVKCYEFEGRGHLVR
jgi:hypothetical protein